MWATGDAGPPAVNTSASRARSASPRSLRLTLATPAASAELHLAPAGKGRDANIIVKFLGTLNGSGLSTSHLAPLVCLFDSGGSAPPWKNSKITIEVTFPCLRKWVTCFTGHASDDLVNTTTEEDVLLTAGGIETHSDEETFCPSYFVNNANKQERSAARPYPTLTSDLLALRPVTFTCLFSKLPLWHSLGSQVSFQYT